VVVVVVVGAITLGMAQDGDAVVVALDDIVALVALVAGELNFVEGATTVVASSTNAITCDDKDGDDGFEIVPVAYRFLLLVVAVAAPSVFF
jgi:hypothetical protein